MRKKDEYNAPKKYGDKDSIELKCKRCKKTAIYDRYIEGKRNDNL